MTGALWYIAVAMVLAFVWIASVAEQGYTDRRDRVILLVMALAWPVTLPLVFLIQLSDTIAAWVKKSRRPK